MKLAKCPECGEKYGSEGCNELRDYEGWTPTKVKDYKKLDNQKV